MPDRWGRVNHNDWNAMTGMINNIQAMGQRNQQYKQQQDDRAEQQDYKDSVNYNVAALSEDPAPVKPYEVDGKYVAPDKLEQPKTALMGTPLSQVAAREVVAKDKRSRQVIKSAEQSETIQKLENNLWKQYATMPEEERDQFLKTYTPKSAEEFRAFASFGNAISDTAQFKTDRMKQNMEMGAMKFQEFSAKISAGQPFLKNGNPEIAEGYLVSAINDSHHPLFLQKNKNGTYDLIYEEMGQKSLMGDDITLEQAYEKAASVPAKDFVADFAAQSEMVAKKNREAQFNVWKKGGKAYEVTTVYDKMNPRVGKDVVYEKNGGLATNPDGTPMTREDLTASGFRPENLDREKNLKDLDYKDQQIATSKAAMGSHQAAGKQDNVKALKSQIDFYNKQFKSSLEPFKEGAGGIGVNVDENGQVSFDDGGAAFSKSQDFFHDHQRDWQTLSPQEQTKFHGAATADALYKNMISLGRQDQAMGGQPAGGQQTGQTTEQIPYTGSQPPPNAPGAKRDKKGLWYVQKNGRWELVLGDGQQQPAPAEQGADVSPLELKPSHGADGKGLEGSAAASEQPATEAPADLRGSGDRKNRNRLITYNPNAGPDEIKKAAQTFVDAGESVASFVKEWGVPALQTLQKMFLADPLMSAGSLSQWLWGTMTDAQKRSIDRLTGQDS